MSRQHIILTTCKKDSANNKIDQYDKDVSLIYNAKNDKIEDVVKIELNLVFKAIIKVVLYLADYVNRMNSKAKSIDSAHQMSLN